MLLQDRIPADALANQVQVAPQRMDVVLQCLRVIRSHTRTHTHALGLGGALRVLHLFSFSVSPSLLQRLCQMRGRCVPLLQHLSRVDGHVHVAGPQAHLARPSPFSHSVSPNEFLQPGVQVLPYLLPHPLCFALLLELTRPPLQSFSFPVALRGRSKQCVRLGAGRASRHSSQHPPSAV